MHKKSSKTSPRIIISGGGTGGHIYPAIAIADEIKSRMPEAEILFVGALGKMEMEKVPKAGYQIKGLPISGIVRGNLMANLKFPLKLQKSLSLASKIIKEFQPDVAIGTGGYASGPLLWQAAKNNIPVIIQEQNSFPGITNKILKSKAAAICVAYDGIKEFPAQKVHLTGNPIRSEIFQNLTDKEVAIHSFGLDTSKKTILSIGGSQGSRTLNNAWLADVAKIQNSDIQLIWQTGKLEYEKIKSEVPENLKGIHITEFIYDMKTAFAAADVIVSRAGAMAISELALIGKPVILVPFPFAAEDHQTKNAQSLVQKNAALMYTDQEVPAELVDAAIDLIQDLAKQEMLAENLKSLGKPNATKEIVDILLSQIK
jgi:UDP-N-acetylglucosamine--N-acetylmuramyl-(pentapeptide) pyrophosphoryl-undecaprenol N-acetylglucosamine transferase